MAAVSSSTVRRSLVSGPNVRLFSRNHVCCPGSTVLGNVAFGLKGGESLAAKPSSGLGTHIALVGLADLPMPIRGSFGRGDGAARRYCPRPDGWQPRILLLDEPLGALDAMTKITMQEELVASGAKRTSTMIMVTDDLEEAIYLADRVLVLPKEKGGIARVIDRRSPPMVRRSPMRPPWPMRRVRPTATSRRSITITRRRLVTAMGLVLASPSSVRAAASMSAISRACYGAVV